jgi:hypothetical protein
VHEQGVSSASDRLRQICMTQPKTKLYGNISISMLGSLFCPAVRRGVRLEPVSNRCLVVCLLRSRDRSHTLHCTRLRGLDPDVSQSHFLENAPSGIWFEERFC